jgi:hypothetical protein
MALYILRKLRLRWEITYLSLKKIKPVESVGNFSRIENFPLLPTLEAGFDRGFGGLTEKAPQ